MWSQSWITRNKSLDINVYMRKDKTNKQTKIDQEENEESATFNKERNTFGSALDTRKESPLSLKDGKALVA